MATQDPSLDIPVLRNPEQASLRLLELPLELLELISSSNSPRLYFKSAAPSSDDSKHVRRKSISKFTAPAHSVLCTQSRTYQVRQVQTSNTVLILRPDISSTQDEISDVIQQSLTAVSTCTSSLELTPFDKAIETTPTLKTADLWLKSLLQDYTPLKDQSLENVEAFEVDEAATVPSREISKRDVFSNIPFSTAECEAAWRTLLIFQDREGNPVIPSAKTLLHLWTSVFATVDVTQPLAPSELSESLRDAGLPTELFNKALRHLSSPRSTTTTHRPLDAEADSDEYEEKDIDFDALVQLDKDTTVDWVGEIHYGESVWPESGTRATKEGKGSLALDGWRELLPEVWAAEVSLDRFSGLKYDRFKPDAAEPLSAAEAKRNVGNEGKNPDAADGNAAKKRPGKSRDWHTKLKRPKPAN